MDSMHLMALGEYRFALSTAAYTSLERDTEWLWPTVDVVGFWPKPQFVGRGRDEVRLSGVVYPNFGGGLGQLDAMRDEANKGVPLNLTCGQGKFWGRWAITRLHEGQTVFFSNGAPRRQDFELSLLFVDFGLIAPAPIQTPTITPATPVTPPETLIIPRLPAAE